MRRRTERKPRRPRRGAIVVLVAVLLVVILGVVACALDVGWIVMTRTQLQAAADSAALAAGTELLPGLGYRPTREPGQVVAAGTPVAVHYAARHRNGNVASTYLSASEARNDIQFLWATFNPAGTGSPAGAGTWTFASAGPDGWYNAVRATARRDQAGSSNADQPLPLILAPVLGSSTSDLTALATAVIMPARGFAIEPGSPISANALPFALYQDFWAQYRRAQDHYAEYDVDLTSTRYLETLQTIPDPHFHPDGFPANPDKTTWKPLFGNFVSAQNKNDDVKDFVEDGYRFREFFTDDWSASPSGLEDAYASPTYTTAGDGILELNAYPHDYSPGNFGILDLGSANQNKELNDQIFDGISDTHLSNMGLDPAVGITMSTTDPFSVTGVTGIRTQMETTLGAPLLSIIGQCRAVFLFSNDISSLGNGTNSNFDLVNLAGIRIMDVKLTGNMELKNITIQMCNASLQGAIADLTDEIGRDTTVFTPLMLIE